MPDRYFRNRPLDQMVEDIHLTHRFMWRQISKQDQALEPIVHWRHDRDRGFSALDLVTWDRPAIFCKFAGALAAAGLTILSARIFTRSDGTSCSIALSWWMPAAVNWSKSLNGTNSVP